MCHLQCSIFNRERRVLAIWDGTNLSLVLYATFNAPYSIAKEGSLHSEMALTCLWGHVAHGSVPRGKPHIQDVPQQLQDGVQCDRHNHTASCPSQTGDACKETSGLHTLLIMFVPKYSPLFLYNHLSLQFFHQIIVQFWFVWYIHGTFNTNYFRCRNLQGWWCMCFLLFILPFSPSSHKYDIGHVKFSLHSVRYIRNIYCWDKHHNVLNRLWNDGLSCICLYM
jgi:hypothetical protein